MPDTKDVLLIVGFAIVALVVLWAVFSGRLKEVSAGGLKVVMSDPPLAPKEPELPGLPPGPITPSPRRYSPIPDYHQLFLTPGLFKPVPVLMPHELWPRSDSRFQFTWSRGFLKFPEMQEAIDDMCDYARIGETTVFALSSTNWPLEGEMLEHESPAAMCVRRRFKWGDGRPACVIDISFPESRDLKAPRPYNAVFSRQHGWIAS